MLVYLHKQVDDFPFFWNNDDKRKWLMGFHSCCCCMLTTSKISIEEFTKITDEIDKYLEQLKAQ